MKTTEKIADAIRAGYDSVLIRERYEADLLEEVMGLPEYQDPTPDTPNVSGYEIREAGMLLEILAESEAADVRGLLEDIAGDWVEFQSNAL